MSLFQPSPIAPFHLHFVGIGPQRTGTSWLNQLLQWHPALCLPQATIEPMFFDRYYTHGLSRYVSHFSRRRPDQRCGEISPTYFDVEPVPERIYQLNPACRIIINLRNPISRTLSLYRHHLSKGRVKGSFRQAAAHMPRIIAAGRYAQHISRWLDVFGPAQVTFVLLDDVKCKPEAVLWHIYQFLDVNPIDLPQAAYDKINGVTMPHFPGLARLAARWVTRLQAGGYYQVIELGKRLGLKQIVYAGSPQAAPRLTPDDHNWLLATYEADIIFIENLLNRDLTTWRQPKKNNYLTPDT
jgi:Sulfotransferase domain